MEFAVEAKKLLELSLEGAVGQMLEIKNLSVSVDNIDIINNLNFPLCNMNQNQAIL